MEKRKKFTISDHEWRNRLSPEQYHVLRQQGTECAFTGPFLDEKRPGTYACAGCGAPLFHSRSKYNSGTGWPSFFAAMDAQAVTTRQDISHGMKRTEILCACCDGHLGHVFPDGPPPTGLRYCTNGLAFTFIPEVATATTTGKADDLG